MAKFIVVVEPGRLESVLNALRAMGVRVVKVVQPYYILVEAPQEMKQALEAVQGVSYVWAERVYRIALPVNVKLREFIRRGGPLNPAAMLWAASFRKDRWPTSISRRVLGADVADSMGVTGRGVKVAVVDTGFDATPQKLRVDFVYSTMELQPVGLDEQGHGCVSPDTFIYTSSCGLTTIKEFYESIDAPEVWNGEGWVKEVRGEVYTIGWDGEPKAVRVLKAFKLPYKGEVIRVRAGTAEFIVTPWHPFLVYEPRYRRYKYVKAEDLVHSHRNYGLAFNTRIVELPFRKTVSEDLAYLAGLFVADGTWAKGAVWYCLHEKEAPVFTEYLEKLGYRYWIKSEKRKTRGRVVIVYGLISEMKRIFKDRVKDRIPATILKQPPSVILAFLAGIVDGDGYFDRDRARCRIVTSSEPLAKQLVNLLTALGYDARITYSTNTGGKNKKPIWTVSVIGESYYRFVNDLLPYLKLKPPGSVNAGHKKQHPYLMIKSVERVSYEGYLYDLMTESGNYLAGRLGMVFVHNTHVLTTIAGRRYPTPWGWLEGVAKGASIGAFKSLGYGLGFGSTMDVMEALIATYSWGAKIVNLSLGSDIAPGETHDVERCPLCSLVTMLAERGVLVVVASGNSGVGYSSCPALSPGAISVGALNKDLTATDFTSRRHPLYESAGKPEVSAPGAHIGSSTTGLIDVMEWVDGPRIAYVSGSSMSAPHVSALLALWVEYAKTRGVELDREAVMDIVRSGAEAEGRSWSPDIGYGPPRFEWVVDYLRR